MKKELPCLTPQRLNTIFDNVYSEGSSCKLFGDDDRMNHLVVTLKSMQSFNYLYRPEDTQRIFKMMNKTIAFEPNSEGTSLWLSLILAMKDLYGFSSKSLLEVMSQVAIRK